MPEYSIIEIDNNTIDLLSPFAEEALEDNDTFMQRTIDEWKSGKNTFSKEGEKFWGLMIQNELVAVGGLNIDPFVDDPTVGRVRHVYVLKKYRGLGLSKILMKMIIDKAKQHFKILRLSTHNPVAASLYESLGFEKAEGHKVTHIIEDLSQI